MLKPKIGITTHGRNEKNQFAVSINYVLAVRRAGGIPYLLSPCAEEDGACLEMLDGLVFSGGCDIQPLHYGGEQHPMIRFTDAERDICELVLAKIAIEKKIPTLAICRGAQLINVVEGGTLYPHVPENIGTEVPHYSADITHISHSIRLDENNRLHKLLGTKTFEAASFHHQCVCRLANSLVATGYAPDGIIEAMEMPSHPWLIAVQWHPEITAAEDPLQQRLFDDLVRASLEKKC